MPGEQVGAAYAKIGLDAKDLDIGLASARSKVSSTVSGIEADFKTGMGSGLQSSVSGLTASMGPLGSAISGVSGGLGLAATAGLAGVAALGALGAASVSTAANWESLMASVSKTTGVSGPALDQLSGDLQRIRTETGATAEDIANAVTVAGSVGIPSGELAEFTEVALQMGSAFSMSSEAAVSGISAIGNSAKDASTSWTEFATMAGSSVNVLADSMRTSEAQILTGMTHLGATMGLLKPPEDTIPEWMAVVATVQSLGLAGDQAGEAIQDALTYAARDTKGAISSLLGISGTQLQLDLRSNAPEVLQNVARAIAALPVEQQAQAMAAFGSTGSKAIALLMGDLDTATGEFDKLGTAIDVSNKAAEEGTSLSSAYAASQSTLDASTGRLTATLDVAGQKLGTLFLPMLADGVDFLTDLAKAAIATGEAVSDLGSSWNDWISSSVSDSAALENAYETANKGHWEMMAGDAIWVEDAVADAVESGTEEGMEKGSEAAKDQIEDDLTDAATSAAEAFAKANDEYIKAHPGGMSLVNGQIIGGADHTSEYLKPGTQSSFASLFDNYFAQHFTGESVEAGGFWTVFDGSGKVVAEKVFDLDAWKSEMRPIVLDLEKYFETAGTGITSTLSSAIQDGVIDPLTEKPVLEGLLDQLNEMEKTYPLEFEASGLGELRGKVEDALKGVPVTFEPEDNYIEVLTAYFKNNGKVDWNALGVSNPSRYLDYAKSQLASEVSGYAEQGRIVPEGETRDMFVELQNWFHTNYSTLDSVNRTSSALLDQAIAKGGLYWDALYAQMGLLSTDIKTAGTVAGNAIETKSAAGAQKIFDASGAFKIGTDSAGRDIAVIGSQVRSDGVAGGQAVADGCQTGANTLVGAFSSIGSIAGAITGGVLSSLFNSAAAKSNATYPIAATTNTLGFTAGSDLNNFGGVPKGWTSAVSEASVATQGAVAQTTNLTSGVTALDGTSGTCASSVSGLNSELSQFHVLAATTATTLATSSASLAASNNLLQYTAEGVSDSMYDCECAISDFAKAQESTPGLFYQSYIGPTSGYSGVAGGGAATAMSSYSLPPIFSFANEGYVPSPTLAVIGDRPGGEYVVGAARFENAMGKMGQGVTINVTQNINGSGLSAAELEYVLERNNKALVAEITDAAKGF